MENLLTRLLGNRQFFFVKDLENVFNVQFGTSHWKRNIFKSLSVDSDPSFNQCGFYCHVSIDQCDFFSMELNYCHLGRYNYIGNSDGVHTELVTYHKSGFEYA